MRSILLAPIMGVMLGCASTNAVSKVPCVEWSELEANPMQFNGKEISLVGYFDAEFEVCSLRPEERVSMIDIWVMPTSESDICSLKQATERPLSSAAMITGTFHFGARYGHLGTYNAAIAGAHVQLKNVDGNFACHIKEHRP